MQVDPFGKRLEFTMQCVLHIGTEKTGTTLLQQWLYGNRALLRRQGVYLSDHLGKPNNRLLAACFQHRLDGWTRANGINTLQEKARYFEHFLERLSDEIRSAALDHQCFLITSEHFHSRVTRAEDIRALSEFLRARFERTKIVCYFRNQFDLAVSSYSTHLRGGHTGGLEDFLRSATPENYYYNHLEIANHWSSAFGLEHCDFRIYGRDAFLDNDLRRDFIQTLEMDINLSAFDFSIATANEALHTLQGAAFRATNSAVPYWKTAPPGISEINNLIKRALLGVERLKTGPIRSPDRDRIETRFEPCNAEFFRRFLGCENRFRSQVAESVEPSSLTQEEVEAILHDALLAVLSALNAPR